MEEKVISEMITSIGSTPVVNMGKLAPKNVFVKLEHLNPSGSIKDIMAHYIMQKAEERGELKKGMTILEVTSGNTGIAFSMLSAMRGYKFVAVMPEHLSKERRMVMKSFGAELVLTPKKLDMQGAVDKYDELKKSIRNVWLPKQFENENNINAHMNVTGREIIKRMPKVDAIVAGVGTGGTLIGVAKAIKKVNPNVKVIAIEPAESSVLLGKKPGHHNIQGIGEGFIPGIIEDNRDMVDHVFAIKTKDAEAMTRRIASEEGYFVGTSSGANLLGAIKASKLLGKDKHILTLFCDRGERYFSTGLFS